MPENNVIYSVPYVLKYSIMQDSLKSCTCNEHDEEEKVVKFDKLLYFEMD